MHATAYRFFILSPVLALNISRNHTHTAVDHVLHEPVTQLLLYPATDKFSASRATEFFFGTKTKRDGRRTEYIIDAPTRDAHRKDRICSARCNPPVPPVPNGSQWRILLMSCTHNESGVTQVYACKAATRQILRPAYGRLLASPAEKGAMTSPE